MRHLLYEFDRRYTVIIQNWSSRLRPLMKFASMTGFPFATIGIGALLVAIGPTQFDKTAGVIVLLTIFVGSVLKIWLRRARPMTYAAKRWFFSTFSFPSGHSTGAMVSYGALVLVLFRSLDVFWAVIGSVALLGWVVLIGLSRVYLGAHYPSDVVAGWLLGIVGLIAIGSFAG
jgi:undecaprenyl-diphosphatase